MDLYHDSCAPAVDRGVLARLQRLDPLLQVTFSQFAIDPATSRPLEVHPGPDWEDDPEARKRIRRRGDTHYLLDPCFHLWTPVPDGSMALVQSYPLDKGGFGHLAVRALEADVARRMTPSEVARLIHNAKRENRRREYERFQRYRNDVAKANSSRVHDLLEEGKGGVRQAKITSFPGQKSRSTPGNVQMDDREAGWEHLSEDEYKRSY